MNDKLREKIDTMIFEQDSEISVLEKRIKDDRENLKQLKIDNRKLKSLFRKRKTIKEDDIIPNEIINTSEV